MYLNILPATVLYIRPTRLARPSTTLITRQLLHSRRAAARFSSRKCVLLRPAIIRLGKSILKLHYRSASRTKLLLLLVALSTLTLNN